jgi:hypothetical protein
MSLTDIWDARDEVYELLQQTDRDAAAMASIERTVGVLMSDLERSTSHYALTRGTNTPEGRMALINLSAAQEDLHWVAVQRDTATDMELRDKLHHALRCSVNGLALLRWSTM